MSVHERLSILVTRLTFFDRINCYVFPAVESAHDWIKHIDLVHTWSHVTRPNVNVVLVGTLLVKAWAVHSKLVVNDEISFIYQLGIKRHKTLTPPIHQLQKVCALRLKL